MAPQPCTYASEQCRQRTVLLVEDEPFVREVTCSILERAGFSVVPAEDADDAIEVYEKLQRPIDLVMTDMILPGRTGQELARDLRQRSPEVKILITSGYGNAEYAIEDPESQTYFLAKPYSRRGLVEKIEEILEMAPQRRAASQAG